MKKVSVKIKRFKIIAFLLAGLLLAAIPLVSCEPSNDINIPDNGYGDEKGAIISGGMTQYEIVIPADANETTQYAAEELANFAFEASGAAFIVTSDDEVPPYSSDSKYISIGNTKLMEESGGSFDYDKLQLDGFFIKTIGQSIFMDALNDRGILYSAYDFLEKFFGIRFLAPDDTHIPKISSIPLYDLNIIENPAFKTRIYWYASTGARYYPDQEYAARMRTSAPEMFFEEHLGGNTTMFLREGSGHNYLYYVPQSVYKTDYPEFYVDFSTNPSVPYDTICVTNGISESGEIDKGNGDIYVDENNYLAGEDISVAAVVAYEMKKDILANPNATQFMLGHMDGDAYCSCDECNAQREDYGDTYMHVRLTNAVAKELKNDPDLLGRDFSIVMYAYSFAKNAPLDEQGNPYVTLEDNVIVQIAMAHNNYYELHSEVNKEFFETMDDWKKCADTFMFFGYDRNFADYQSYYPSFHLIKDIIKMLQSYNVTNLLWEGAIDCDNDWHSMMASYIWHKMMWNPDLDPAVLYNEYIDLYYKNYSGYMREFIQGYEDYYAVYADRLMKEENPMGTNTRQSVHDNLPKNLLTSRYDIIKNALAALETDETLTPADRALMRQKLSRVIITPMWKLMENYNDYFGIIDQIGKQNIAIEFFNYCDIGGVTKVWEGRSVDDHRAKYGL